MSLPLRVLPDSIPGPGCLPYLASFPLKPYLSLFAYLSSVSTVYLEGQVYEGRGFLYY